MLNLLAIVLIVAVVSVNAGGTWKAVNVIKVNVSGTWKNVLAGWVNVSGTWKKFFQSGPYVSAATASVYQYGAGFGGCTADHINRITFTITGTCSGHTVRIYEPSYGEWDTGIACNGSPRDHNLCGQVSSAGTGLSWSYVVRLYDSGPSLVSSLACNTITAQDDGACFC